MLMPFYHISFFTIFLCVGFLLWYPLSHEYLTTSTKKLMSGPFASKEEWFTPIEEIFYKNDVGETIYDWFLTNPAILALSNLVMLVLTSYYWKRVTLFS